MSVSSRGNIYSLLIVVFYFNFFHILFKFTELNLITWLSLAIVSLSRAPKLSGAILRCTPPFQVSNGPSDSYAAVAQADRLQGEPESLRRWREEQRERLEALGERVL